RGHRPARTGGDQLRLSRHRERAIPHAPVAHSEVRQSQARPEPRASALRRGAREADLRGAAPHARPQPRLRGPPVHGRALDPALCAVRGGRQLSRRDHRGRQGRAHVRVLGHRLLRGPSPVNTEAIPLLRVRGLSHSYGAHVGCLDVGFDLWPGEVLGVVGESGSGKTTLLGCLAGRLSPASGSVWFTARDGRAVDMLRIGEAARRRLLRTEWGIVHQNPRDGLRMRVSAGANVGERLMAVGERHYGRLRETALAWLAHGEIDDDRVEDLPETFPGGMQQRLQIARNLVTRPRLVLMDEPTGGLDVSVQARLLDLLRGLVADLDLSAIVVTHDLAVTRLLTHRLLVMRRGEIVEYGLTDQVLTDPQPPYTQLLVSSVLPP